MSLKVSIRLLIFCVTYLPDQLLSTGHAGSQLVCRQQRSDVSHVILLWASQIAADQ